VYRGVESLEVEQMHKIIGEGPAQTVQVNPKQPMWMVVAR
jgi:hypothetical protein